MESEREKEIRLEGAAAKRKEVARTRAMAKKRAANMAEAEDRKITEAFVFPSVLFLLSAAYNPHASLFALASEIKAATIHKIVRVAVSRLRKELVQDIFHLRTRRLLHFIHQAKHILRWLKTFVGPLPLLNKIYGQFRSFVKARAFSRARNLRMKTMKLLRRQAFMHPLQDKAARKLQAKVRYRRLLRRCEARKVDSSQLKAALLIQRVARKKRKQCSPVAHLIRPGSTFIVLWQLLLLAVSLIEIARIFVSPELFLHVVDSTCTPQPARRRIFSLCQKSYKRVPEHCLSAAADVEAAKSAFSKLLATVASLNVGVVFFTGRLNPVNLVLEPRPWFKRYVFPGLIMQCLLHPGWSFIGEFVDHFMLQVGVVRFFAFVVLAAEVGMLGRTRFWR